MHRTKRSWPLFLLAGSSFLPGFGLFFGAVAATWGLVSDRPRAMLAAGVGATGALLNLLVARSWCGTSSRSRPLPQQGSEGPDVTSRSWWGPSKPTVTSRGTTPLGWRRSPSSPTLCD
jgi:hypothetical protein